MSHNVQHQIAAIMRRRGGFSFGTALRLLEPYSPRLAFNFIDPANSLFQGTTLTPATTVTNPIGVVIDQTQGGLGNLGAELLTNGGFDTNLSGWTTEFVGSPEFVWSSGKALVTNASTNIGLQQASLSLDTNKTYLISYDLAITTGSIINVRFGDGTSGSNIPNASTATSGTKQLISRPAGAGTKDKLLIQVTTGSTLTIDNVSVREIPGNHATASSDAKRPLFARRPATGRRNLAISTEDLADVAWTKSNVTAVSENASFTKIEETVVTNQFIVTQSRGTIASGLTITFSVYAKADERGFIRIALGGSAFGTNDAWFNLTNGTVGTTRSVAAAIQDAGDGYYRCSITAASTGAGTSIAQIFLANADGVSVYTGTLGSGVIVGKIQWEYNSTATNYQRVVTSADVTEAGVRDVYAALFDGSDDCLQVSGFDLSNTDEVCVIAGVRKLAETAPAVVVETSASMTLNDGTIRLLAPQTTATGDYSFASKGTVQVNAVSATTYVAPHTAFLIGTADISADNVRLIVNGVTTTGTADQGTGNYGNYTLYIGQRAGTSLPFNGGISYLFILGAIPPDDILTRIYRGLAPQIGVSV